MHFDMTISLGTMIHLVALLAAISVPCRVIIRQLQRIELKQDDLLSHILTGHTTPKHDKQK